MERRKFPSGVSAGWRAEDGARFFSRKMATPGGKLLARKYDKM